MKESVGVPVPYADDKKKMGLHRLSWAMAYCRRHTKSFFFGSRQASNKAFANTFGLPFSVSPDDALNKFRVWASKDQGLSQMLLGQNLGITAAYCPVWTFDLNVKFIDKQKRKAMVPESLASAFPNQSILHLPGLSAYAGYT